VSEFVALNSNKTVIKMNTV